MQGHSLEVQRIVGRSRSTAEIVLLHEGPGSISHWRDFPVAKATGSAVKVYWRYGRGNSDLLAGPRPVSYMHDEALHALPDLLAQLPIGKPILLGHSDGASIARIDAGAQDRVCGLVLLASPGFVECLSVKGIA